MHFADWQACTDGHKLLDSVLSQNRETIVVLELERLDGSRCMHRPAIWVDQDISSMRGLLQGWPREIGGTWLTRICHWTISPQHRCVAGASLA